MRKVLFASALSALIAAGGIALAQVNTVPQIGVITATQKQPTYSAVSRALVPAASATDIFCISGSATRNISIKRVAISGFGATAINVPMTILRRTTLDTGGTAATGTAAPVAVANTTSDPASTATLIAYTANPTINDSSPTLFRSGWVGLPLSSSGTSIPQVVIFGEQVGFFTHALNILKNQTAQQYCLNLNSTTVSSGQVDIDITWTETN